MRAARIKGNGEEGVLEVHYGDVEKAIAGAIIALLVGLCGTGIVGGVVLYREVGEIKARQEENAHAAMAAADAASRAAAGVARDLGEHLRWANEQAQKMVTRDELARERRR